MIGSSLLRHRIQAVARSWARARKLDGNTTPAPDFLAACKGAAAFQATISQTSDVKHVLQQAHGERLVSLTILNDGPEALEAGLACAHGLSDALVSLAVQPSGFRAGPVQGFLEELPPLPAVEHVDLSGSRLRAQGASSLSAALLPAKHLQSLQLDFCDLSSRGAQCILEAAAQLGHVSRVSLRGLHGSLAVSDLPAVLPHLPWLQTLDLSISPLSPDGAEALSATFPHMQRLQRLVLQGTALDTGLSVQMRRSLQRCHSLQVLDLARNPELGDQGVQAWLDASLNFPMLQSLFVHGCGSSQPSVQTAARTVLSSRTLTGLSLGDSETVADFGPLLDALVSRAASLPWEALHLAGAAGPPTALQPLSKSQMDKCLEGALAVSCMSFQGVDGHNLLQSTQRGSPSARSCGALDPPTLQGAIEDAAVAAGLLPADFPGRKQAAALFLRGFHT